MIHFKNVQDAQKLCECLAAPARMEILGLVLSHRAESLDYLARTLHLSNGAITQHVKKLCDAGLVKLEEAPGKRGTLKKCVIAVDRVVIDVAGGIEISGERTFDIPIGSFSSAQVKPYCGIASPFGWIGERDDPRYFTYPERADACLIYFNSGKLGWTLPEPAPERRKLKSVSVSFEISSKPYGHGRSRESSVGFWLNDVKLGEHVVDGEFTDRNGLFTPSFLDEVCQYGKYKTITVNGSGCFFDGIKIGMATISDFSKGLSTFSVSTDNGLAIFGSGAGDYGSALRFKLEYDT